MTMQYIGVDGCKFGWFYVALDNESGWKVGVVDNINELLSLISVSEATLIDIPIGLRGTEKNERLCDLSARKALGKRRSSVFPAPCRRAVYCTDYKQASDTNYMDTGRKLSKQSWGITSKIKEVDAFLRKNPQLNNVYEMHPELCFWALNNKKEMTYSKKKLEGFEERVNTLTTYYCQSSAIIDKSLTNYRRKDVAKDDVLDALVGAVTARNRQPLKTMPATPEFDIEGIKMGIVY